MSEIIGIHAREILDSRGNPTVEVEVWTEFGVSGRAAVPSGASTGSFEALELRDKDENRYMGKGVLTAVENVKNIIAPEIIGMDVTNQALIDNAMIELDGTENKERLGANAMLGVSMAVARAAAVCSHRPLYAYLGGVGPYIMPTPMMNVINGGAHADNNIDIQEFMIVPHGFDSFTEALMAGVQTYHVLKKNLKSKGLSTAIGDEGGFAPNLKSNKEALTLLLESIKSAGYQPGEQISLALDVATTELFKEEKYHFRGEGIAMTRSELVAYYSSLVDEFPIVSIEDGMAEEDWEGWIELTEKLGEKVQLVGDDIFVTNPTRLMKGFEKDVANSILIKLNQIGTVSETMGVVRLAMRNSYTAVISHRSGETDDSFIADLAVATGAGQIKTGAPARIDRVAKYNQLLRIEEELEGESEYPGLRLFNCWSEAL